MKSKHDMKCIKSGVYSDHTAMHIDVMSILAGVTLYEVACEQFAWPMSERSCIDVLES
jgi:hypothetical protein